MVSGWRYRLAGIGGTVLATLIAVVLLNHPVIASLWSTAPIGSGLSTNIAVGSELVVEATIAAVVMAVVCTPLYKPRPRRILDTISLTQRQVLIGFLALATIGYFDYTYRLPRLTLLGLGVILLVVLPAWFVWIRISSGDGTWIFVGDDPDLMADLYAATDHDIVGYVSPPFLAGVGNNLRSDGGVLTQQPDRAFRADTGIPRLGGLANLDDVLVDYDVDTALLAFAEADRGEFFGVLDTCYEHSVTAKVHRAHADHVLIGDDGGGPIVDVDLRPLDIQDYVLKRVFDVLFAYVGLMVLSPVMLVIGIAVKLESPGPILYEQERTATFGRSFTVYKFRTMVPEVEDPSPIDDEANNRITRIGRVLRATHLDEIPQLFTILTGEMTVVGPRAVWRDEETYLEAQTDAWRRRWFVKPGLTGLAQVNDASSLNPEAKLRYDLEYIRRQSFWFDVKIVIRQLWLVVRDLASIVRQ